MGKVALFLKNLHKVVSGLVLAEEEREQIQRDLLSLEEAVARLEGSIDELERLVRAHIL